MQMQAMLNAGEASRVGTLKNILLGGAPLTETQFIQLQDLHVPVYHGYGMTETYTHIALRKLNGADASLKYKPLPGVEVSQDKRGCLSIRSEVTGGQWLQTNDIVQLFPDGFIWIGRWDNVINTGGVKVQAEAVEREIDTLLVNRKLDIPAFFVAGIPDEKLGQKIIAVFEDEPWSVREKEVFLANLSSSVSRYELPKEIHFKIPFPRTALGKIDKQKILAELNRKS
jgi:O-succinylbenzoic acid--CoA ligase